VPVQWLSTSDRLRWCRVRGCADARPAEGTAELLGRLVDVIDARTGSVRLKMAVAGVDAELANVRSVKTIRVKNR
jgi:VWA domain-containing protein